VKRVIIGFLALIGLWYVVWCAVRLTLPDEWAHWAAPSLYLAIVLAAAAYLFVQLVRRVRDRKEKHRTGTDEGEGTSPSSPARGR